MLHLFTELLCGYVGVCKSSSCSLKPLTDDEQRTMALAMAGA